MKYENIVIRTKNELSHSKDVVKTALLAEAKSANKPNFPLVYKYLGKSGVSETNDIRQEDTMGTIGNIRLSSEGDVICDVTLNVLTEKSKHFSGVVDNVVIGMVKTRNYRIVPTLISAVVYDRFAKSMIDERNKIDGSSCNVTRLGDTPVSDKVANDKDFNPLWEGGTPAQKGKMEEVCDDE